MPRPTRAPAFYSMELGQLQSIVRRTDVDPRISKAQAHTIQRAIKTISEILLAAPSAKPVGNA